MCDSLRLITVNSNVPLKMSRMSEIYCIPTGSMCHHCSIPSSLRVTEHIDVPANTSKWGPHGLHLKLGSAWV